MCSVYRSVEGGAIELLISGPSLSTSILDDRRLCTFDGPTEAASSSSIRAAYHGMNTEVGSGLGVKSCSHKSCFRNGVRS